MAETKEIIISRIFTAPREAVWEAWTKPDLIKKWWGPKDFTAPSIESDFRVGGKYLYCMHGPADTPFDQDMYSAGVYKEIVPKELIVATDYFSDEEGNKLPPKDFNMPEGMPDEMEVTVKFDDIGNNQTKLSIIYHPFTDEARQAMLKSGMEQGWSTSLDKLGQILK